MARREVDLSDKKKWNILKFKLLMKEEFGVFVLICPKNILSNLPPLDSSTKFITQISMRHRALSAWMWSTKVGLPFTVKINYIYFFYFFLIKTCQIFSSHSCLNFSLIQIQQTHWMGKRLHFICTNQTNSNQNAQNMSGWKKFLDEFLIL